MWQNAEAKVPGKFYSGKPDPKQTVRGDLGGYKGEGKAKQDGKEQERNKKSKVEKRNEGINERGFCDWGGGNGGRGGHNVRGGYEVRGGRMGGRGYNLRQNEGRKEYENRRKRKTIELSNNFQALGDLDENGKTHKANIDPGDDEGSDWEEDDPDYSGDESVFSEESDESGDVGSEEGEESEEGEIKKQEMEKGMQRTMKQMNVTPTKPVGGAHGSAQLEEMGPPPARLR